ncbi:glutathione S-transferase T3-like [Salvia splendens]|uniref:glutathione S-transferase T3-like n=1 Tax=Salvia splendens TaxID=180675 RepID=UPI001C26CBA2|nr:glutathione S-transferase T3-like [Salvia splendens]
MALFDAWISTSNVPILGNQQTRKYFWDKVTDVYNAKKPRGAFSRNLNMLHPHFERADRDVKIFCGIYKREAEQYQSGANGSDILIAALQVFKSDTGKDFKFPDVWEMVKHLDSPSGESSSSRMDAHLVDDSDEDFVPPPPPRSEVRGRHSVSHTGGTGEDIGPVMSTILHLSLLCEMIFSGWI